MTNAALSIAIDELRGTFAPHVEHDVTLTHDAVSALTDQLKALGQLARAMEQELDVHRMGEAGKADRGTLDRLAGDVMADVLVETNDNVIRPRFGRKT